MRVLKFGGSSAGTPESILKIKDIVDHRQEQTHVVVSAFKGVTDQLIQTSQQAATRDDTYKSELETIRKRHLEAVKIVVKKEYREEARQTVNQLIEDLNDLLHGVFLLKERTPKTLDYILSFGERLSAYILSKTIENGEFIDSREIIRTDRSFNNAKLDFDTTNKLAAKKFNGFRKNAVLPGFIASSEEMETTTLGRGGSDYSAAILAATLQADMLEIWTDVDGFMTADPRKVEKAYPIQELTYAEAMELSHFGAKVIYTPTIQPVYHQNIPVVIKNTFNPDATGTTIRVKAKKDEVSPIKGISSIDKIDLITLQGAGMVGVTGISMRLFGCLAKEKINIILITQASSEYSISFAVVPTDSKKAKEAIEKEFLSEIKYRQAINLRVEKDLSIIAIVGEGMKNTPGISANLFRSLGQNGVNVVATAQGSSELNISVVVKEHGLKKALNAIHEGFFLSRFKELHLFVAGVGTVGSILLDQIMQQKQKLEEEHHFRINVSGITNSRKMVFDTDGIDITNYQSLMDKQGEKANIKQFVNRIANMNLRNSVFVDCTANEHVASTYKDLFNAYVSVVTANKIACSSNYAIYQELKQTARKKGVKFSFETNVGAGLPIINTINDLVTSGDHILKLEAVLSGTLNYIFNVLSEETSLSQAIQKAKEMGYSEPDPRIDLSGIDVIRKLLILARESGYHLEQKDVAMHPFLPEECFEGSLEDFWEKVKKYDTGFEEKRKQLVAENKKWRFVAGMDQGKAKVELKAVGMEHPAYALEGSNNIILITTERYKELPMVIKGYGAGAEVTAAGVFADIIRMANL